jgi:DNA-binding transcriptional LysR family regulator
VDRLEAMKTFVAVVDHHGFAAAARKLGQSPASVTRAVAALESHFGVRLLQRTTRSVRVTEAGHRFLEASRRILADVEDTDRLMSGERATPKGTLVVTAPLLFGRLKVLPQVDAYLRTYPDVQVQLLLLDRVVNLIDEGVDVAVRIGHLPESNLVAVTVGDVRRVVCASPEYLAGKPPLREPSDLRDHDCIAMSHLTPNEGWSFAAGPNTEGTRQVRIRPRLTVNSAEAAIASCLRARGVIYLLSYQVADELASGRLKRLLQTFELPPVPVQVVFPEARMAAAKTRAFLDALVPALRSELANGARSSSTRPSRARTARSRSRGTTT